jgi:hypothetical protein
MCVTGPQRQSLSRDSATQPGDAGSVQFGPATEFELRATTRLCLGPDRKRQDFLPRRRRTVLRKCAHYGGGRSHVSSADGDIFPQLPIACNGTAAPLPVPIPHGQQLNPTFCSATAGGVLTNNPVANGSVAAQIVAFQKQYQADSPFDLNAPNPNYVGALPEPARSELYR